MGLRLVHLSDVLLAGIADHLDLGDGHMAVFIVALRHVRVGRRVLRVFFHVVHGGVFHRPGRFDCVNDMVGEGNAVTLHFPGASVLAFEFVFISAVALGEAPRDRSHIRL